MVTRLPLDHDAICIPHSTRGHRAVHEFRGILGEQRVPEIQVGCGRPLADLRGVPWTRGFS